MAVLAHCPSPGCSGSYRVPDGFASRSIRCPICKKSFTPGPEKLPTKEAANANTPVADAPGSPKQYIAAAEFPTSSPKGLGRFVVLGRLGVGAFGTVYKARDPHLDRDVALKVPNPGMLESPKRIERFLREARAAARLRHPNIVPVFDAGKEGEHYFIASAFVDGRPLSESIGERGMDVRRAAEIVRRLAEAIAYAHGQGIVHRDIKPANIMLDLDEQPHLMDFGLAARANEAEKLTNDGAVLGTPAYMAPEQAGGKKGEASPRSDQYALGIVLYELLTGEPPFRGPPAAVLYKVIHHEPTPPAQVRGSPLPRDLETICLKAMSKNPDDRYADCQAFADDLRRWLAGEPIAARRHSALERLIRWTKNNRTVAASLAVTALSLVLGAAVAIGFALEARQRSADAENALRAADIAREAAVASAAKADSLLDQLVGEENRGKDLENRVDAIVAERKDLQAARDRHRADAAEIRAKLDAIENAIPPPREVDLARRQEVERLRAALALAKKPAAFAPLRVPLYQSLHKLLEDAPANALEAAARDILDEIPFKERRWEWDYLTSWQKPRIHASRDFQAAGPTVDSLLSPSGDVVFSLVQPTNQAMTLSRSRLTDPKLRIANHGFNWIEPKITDEVTAMHLVPVRDAAASVVMTYKRTDSTIGGQKFYHTLGRALPPGKVQAYYACFIVSPSGLLYAVRLLDPTDWSHKPGATWSPPNSPLRLKHGLDEQLQRDERLLAIDDLGRYLLVEPDRLLALPEGNTLTRAKGIDVNEAVQFSPDSRWLAYVTSVDERTPLKKIILLSLKDPAASPREFVGASGAIKAIAFSSDGERMATAGDEHAVRIWDTATGECLLVLKTTGPVAQVALTPNGRRVVAIVDEPKKPRRPSIWIWEPK